MFTSVGVRFCSAGTKTLCRCPFQHLYISIRGTGAKDSTPKEEHRHGNVKIDAESQWFTHRTWAGRMWNCSPAESLESPCFKALTVLAQTQQNLEWAFWSFILNVEEVSSNHCSLSLLHKQSVAKQHSIGIFHLKGSNRSLQRLVYFLLPYMVSELFGIYDGHGSTSCTQQSQGRTAHQVRVILFFTSWHFAVFYPFAVCGNADEFLKVFSVILSSRDPFK